MKVPHRATSLSVFGALVGLIAVPPVFAQQQQVFVLNFAGLNGSGSEAVDNFYDGGFGSLGSGPGPDYGITFDPNAVVCASIIVQPKCHTAEMPGGPGSLSLGFLKGTGDIVNRPAGFTHGFSFYYSAPFKPGTVSVWSGLDGTGSELALLTLPTTTNGKKVAGCSGAFYCPYTPFGVTFSGVAESIDFSGTVNRIGFADLTLGSSTPGGGTSVPEPGTLALLLLGASMLAVGRRKKAAPASS